MVDYHNDEDDINTQVENIVSFWWFLSSIDGRGFNTDDGNQRQPRGKKSIVIWIMTMMGRWMRRRRQRCTWSRTSKLSAGSNGGEGGLEERRGVKPLRRERGPCTRLGCQYLRHNMVPILVKVLMVPFLTMTLRTSAKLVVKESRFYASKMVEDG